MAKVMVVRKDIANAVRIAEKTADYRHTNEIVRNCKLSVNGRLTIESTDFESVSKTEVATDIEVDDDSRLVNLRQLKTAIAGSRNSACLIEFTADKVIVDSTELQWVESKQFPSYLESHVVGDRCSVSAQQLSDALSYCAVACDEFNSRYALGAIALELHPFGFEAVATDGRRLHHAKIGVDRSEKTVSELLPKDAVKPIVDACKISQSVDIFVSLVQWNHSEVMQKMLTFVFWSNGEIVATVRTRVSEGRYPEWRKVVPSNMIEVATVHEDWKILAKNASATWKASFSRNDENFNCASTWRFCPESVKVYGSVKNSVNAWNSECIADAKESFTVLIDCEYLFEALDGKCIATIYRSNENAEQSPIVIRFFKNGLDFQAVVMPITK